jgi:hypothetical protein
LLRQIQTFSVSRKLLPGKLPSGNQSHLTVVIPPRNASHQSNPPQISLQKHHRISKFKQFPPQQIKTYAATLFKPKQQFFFLLGNTAKPQKFQQQKQLNRNAINSVT